MHVPVTVTFVQVINEREKAKAPFLVTSENEPVHDKTNEMTYAPSKDSDQPWHPPSLICLRCPHEETLGP